MVEHYHRPLQQVYSIIITEILIFKFDLAFQMFFKTIKNFVSPNRLVFILLVFSTYPRITKLDTSSPSIN